MNTEFNSTLSKRIIVTNVDVDRLCKNAEHIISMFEKVYPDTFQRLIYVSALAGYACHMAVKANNESFVKVKTKNGLAYYFGDNVNYYLFGNKFSVVNLMRAYYENKTGNNVPDINPYIKKMSEVVGDNTYLIGGKYNPEQIYKVSRDCWDGIYNNFTEKYCINPSEWPVLYAIILQNIMLKSNLDANDTFYLALECTLFISKMDNDSLKDSNFS